MSERDTGIRESVKRGYWFDRAKCAGQPLEDYDLAEYKRPEDRDDRAKELCEGCPVIKECALDAIDPFAVSTVRGGIWIQPRTGSANRKTIAATRIELATVAGVAA